MSEQKVYQFDDLRSKDYKEWLQPFLMSQRRALLMQVEAVEKLLGIDPTTADLRKKAKRDIIGD